MQYHSQPSLNGHNDPSKMLTSSPPADRRATIFLTDLPISNWRSFLHHLGVAQIVGTPLLRLLTIFWVIATLLGLAGAFRGGIIVGVLLLLALVAFHAHFFVQRRADFVTFEAAATAVKPRPNVLKVEEKVAIYVTGECSVEGKRRRFTCLPGFYRTFATREHALLCQVKDRRIFGFASWNSAEVGLWYVFFRPEAIRSIDQGRLHYGKTALPALAIQHEAVLKVNKNGEPERSEIQTVYISVVEPANLDAILADLLVEATLHQANER